MLPKCGDGVKVVQVKDCETFALDSRNIPFFDVQFISDDMDIITTWHQNHTMLFSCKLKKIIEVQYKVGVGPLKVKPIKCLAYVFLYCILANTMNKQTRV